MSLLSTITGQQWLITEPMLATIMAVATREQHDQGLAADTLRLRREALAQRDGVAYGDREMTTVRDGVGVVEVIGPIMRYANLFTFYSGGTTTQTLALELAQLRDDPQIRAIVLAFDSPGGAATGIHELAQQIAAMRGTKPVVAYVGGMAASAAYWLACACDRIVMDATAEVGSIGVLMALPNPAARSVRDIEIVSSQSPRKRPDVSTESGRGVYQERADALAAVFVADVARLRGVSEDTVLTDFGRGGVLVGQASVAAGMADRLGSLEELLQELSAPERERMSVRSRFGANTKDRTTMDWKAFWTGLVDASGGAQATAPLDAQITANAQDLNPAMVGIPADEYATLKAAAEAEQARAAAAGQAQATAWASEQIAAGKATTADEGHLTAVYAACASAQALPALEAMFANRTAAPSATEPLVPASVLPLAVTGLSSAEQQRAAARAQVERANRRSKRA